LRPCNPLGWFLKLIAVERIRIKTPLTSQPRGVHTFDTKSEFGKARLPVNPLFKRRPLGRAVFLTLISLRLLLLRRGDVRTISPVENGRHIAPTKRQDIAARVFREPIGITWMPVTETIDSSSEEISNIFLYGIRKH
jgi:hypothetical protein